MAIDAVIFDWGGTLTPWHLIDPGEPWHAYASVVEPSDPDPVAAALLIAEQAAWAGVLNGHLSARFADVLDAAEVPYDDRAIEAYRAAWEPHTFTDPDVPVVFGWLRERGIRVGVLSNTIWPRDWHESFFTRDGVLDLVDGDVYTSEIPYTKPHEQAFRSAMAAVGVDDPSRCVFVGDRPYDDISGASALGMRAIFVPHSEIPVEQRVPVDVHPDAVVQRLGEVIDHVDTWAEGRAVG